MSTLQVVAGNIVRASVVFTPDTGTVDIADVTAWFILPGGVATAITPIVTTGTNAFYGDIEVPDTALGGTWQVRWESNEPSPKISEEGVGSTFAVRASKSSTP